MSRKRQNDITRIVRRAEAEGLSYGRYVAQERAIRAQRKIPVLDIAKPRGISTIQAALPIDCPRLCACIGAKTEKELPEPKSTNPFAKTPDGALNDEAAILYKQGYSVTSIAHKLGTTRYNITERLRRADVEIRSKKHGGLPAEKVLKIRTLHAQGLTLRRIAIECDTVESTVRRYLKED